MVLFVPLSGMAGRSSIMIRCKSEAPFVVANCTAPIPMGTSFGTETWKATSPELGSFVWFDETRAALAEKLVHNPVAPFNVPPKKVTTVVLPGATAEGEE